MYSNNYIVVFGNNLRKAREKRNLTQIQLAEKLSKYFVMYVDVGREVDAESLRPRLSAWENGRKIPDLSECIALCNILDVEMDYLLGISEATSMQLKACSEITGLTMGALEKLAAMWSDSEYFTSADISEFIESDSGLGILIDIIKFLHTDYRYFWTGDISGYNGITTEIAALPHIGYTHGEYTKLSARDIEDASIFKIVSGIRKWKDEISNAKKD